LATAALRQRRFGTSQFRQQVHSAENCTWRDEPFRIEVVGILAVHQQCDAKMQALLLENSIPKIRAAPTLSTAA
jgi:hypothetical protein